jgi:hypothetical protein
MFLFLHIAEIAQALQEDVRMMLAEGTGSNSYKSYPGDILRLLCLGHHSKSKQHHCNKD